MRLPRPPQRAWHARAIDATSNTNKKATNKFEVSYARDKTAHGATCGVTATDGRPNWWQLDLRRIHRETRCSFDRGLRNRVRSVCFVREREVRHATCSVSYKISSDISACATTACTPSRVDNTYHTNNQGTHTFAATCASDETSHGATFTASRFWM